MRWWGRLRLPNSRKMWKPASSNPTTFDVAVSPRPGLGIKMLWAKRPATFDCAGLLVEPRRYCVHPSDSVSHLDRLQDAACSSRVFLHVS